MLSAGSTIESIEQRRFLLRVARETAEQMLGSSRVPTREQPVIEGEFGGVFVTLWSDQRLRGCVGTFAPTNDLIDTIREVTRASLADPRFTANPVVAAELNDLDIEISILSHLEPMADPLSLIPGVHGVVVRQGERSGCFLPKVASERGWSAEELLSNCCTMKASLPADAWRQEGTKVLLFTADAFAESQ